MAFEYSAKEFIKVYRKLLDWEWYTDVNTTKLFLHCLLRANWKPGSWHGVQYNEGQFITSLSSLSEETGLTIKQVRCSLDRLSGTGEIKWERHGNSRIITVNNWNKFQEKSENRAGQTLGQTWGKPEGKKRANLWDEKGQTLSTENTMVCEVSSEKVGQTYGQNLGKPYEKKIREEGQQYKNIYKNTKKEKEKDKKEKDPDVLFEKHTVSFLEENNDDYEIVKEYKVYWEPNSNRDCPVGDICTVYKDKETGKIIKVLDDKNREVELA